MTLKIEDCPCSGKNMKFYLGPWILLALQRLDGSYGYELKKYLEGEFKELGLGLNTSGLYRHLKAFEKRGMLSSRWDTHQGGVAKRRYSLTNKGRECLSRWVQTLAIQREVIERFFKKAGHILMELPGLGPGEINILANESSVT